MDRNYNKYGAIIAVVIILAVAVHSIFSDAESVYDYSDPQVLQLDEQEFNTIDQDVTSMYTEDDGHISQVYADDENIYYLLEPIQYATHQWLKYESAYIKRINRATGEIKILREFSDMGEFNISKVIYNQDYCFISMTTFDGDNQTDSILKMDNETGNTSIIYETTSVTGGAYRISNISNYYTDNYLIWSECDPYLDRNDVVNEYKLYNIEKDKITTHKIEERNYARSLVNPTLNENNVVYPISNENGDNIILCKSINGEENRKVNIHSMVYGTGFYNDDYLVWDYPVWNGLYGEISGCGTYLFDFKTKEQFLVDEDVLDLKLYDDYIVTVHKKYVNLIDYRNNKKYKYLIKENQKVTSKIINVTDDFIIIDESDENELKVIYKEIIK